MNVRELFTLARQVELRMARLYEHMARSFSNDERMEHLLQSLSSQELAHAKLVEKALARSTDPEAEVDFVHDTFTGFINTIDDVEDEVCTSPISVEDAAEIISHLEESMSENFYCAISPDTPGVDHESLRMLANTCDLHAGEINEFINKLKG